MAVFNITKQLNNLKRFDIQSELNKILREYDFFIIGLLRLQMQEGKDADEKPVFAKYGPFYTDATLFNKKHSKLNGLSKEKDFVTNFMTGEFYRSLELDVKGTVFQITSEVPYFSAIVLRSGIRTIELSQKSLQILKEEIIIPELEKQIKSLSNGF